jgi:aspartate/methionine/tyrosine aminotransferase
VFSRRLPTLTPNRLGIALAAARQAGAPLIDLTETNPTRVGLRYPRVLVESLADPAALSYAPHPLGLATARDAVALDYLRHGLEIDPGRILLTASTSEAYAFLFALLCDPGDSVLVPAPSYPLFDHLTRLNGVEAVAWPLDPHGGWSIDVPAIARLVTPRTRAVLVVSPNNPTGTLLRHRELDALAALCRDRHLALIGDEVFADYRVAPPTRPDDRSSAPVSVLQQRECLTFALGGLSKSIGAPQLKLAWMAVGGPSPLAAGAIDRLELIGDTYLSVSTPVQVALPTLLDAGRDVRSQILERVTANLRLLERTVSRLAACSLVAPDGGWSAVLRVPADLPEEARVLALLEQRHVVVSPGYFYDFPFEAFLVVSLIVAPDVFAAGLDQIAEHLGHSG